MDFKIDLAWFREFLPQTDGVFIIHKENRVPVCLHVDSCTSGCGALSEKEAYYIHCPAHIRQQQLSICHLEMLKAMVAVTLWAPKLAFQLVHHLCDNTTAMAIFQARKSRDFFLQACSKEVLLTGAIWDIILTIGHVA